MRKRLLRWLLWRSRIGRELFADEWNEGRRVGAQLHQICAEMARVLPETLESAAEKLRRGGL